MSSPQSSLMMVAMVLALACQACATTATVPATAAVSARSSSPSPREVRRELLTRRELPELPGWESRMYLVEFPPGAQSPLHEHVVSCVGYVLEGSFESAFGDGPAKVTHAGESFVDLPHEPHRFRNASANQPLRFVIAGTFRKDDPLFRALPQ